MDEGEWLAGDDPIRAARLLVQQAAELPPVAALQQEEVLTTAAERRRGQQVRDNLLGQMRRAGTLWEG